MGLQSKNFTTSGNIPDGLLLDLSNKMIVIDCGHTPVQVNSASFIFGRNGTPSESEVATLRTGVKLLNRLHSMNKNAMLNICFSDTTRFIGDTSHRINLKQKCANGEIYHDLPDVYKEELQGISKDVCSFMLQTVNSNKFSSLIKKVKKDIKKESDIETNYSKYNAYFTKDSNDTLFGFTSDYLLENKDEVSLLDGDWWLDEFSTLHPADIVKAPISPLKKFGLINLYSKNTGILCPATYGGLILHFDDEIDHIAIYSRKDDPHIGEKVLRGVISACTLSSDTYKCKNFLQIIYPAASDDNLNDYTEISFISSPEITANIFARDEMENIFEKRFSYRYKKYI